MTQDWNVPGWAVLAVVGVLVVLIVGLGLIVATLRRRVESRLESTQETSRALAEQVAKLEARIAEDAEPSASADATAENDRVDYVITRIGEREPGTETGTHAAIQTLPRAVFVDLVLRESAVRAAGLTGGLRRALAPETRNRIRFEMKQEVKRSRKQRKADLRAARREWEARQRATDSLTLDSTAERSA